MTSGQPGQFEPDPSGSPDPDGPVDETREMVRPQGWDVPPPPTGEPSGPPPASPWSREAGGFDPTELQAPAFPPEEPRYAGPAPSEQYWSGPQQYQQPGQYPQPGQYQQPGQFQQPGYGQQPPDAYAAPWGQQPGPYGPGWGPAGGPPPGPPNGKRRAGIIAAVAVLVLAIAGGVTAAVVTSSDDDSGTPSAAPTPRASSAPVTPPPGPSSVPAPSSTPTPRATPSLPTSLVPTPAGLRAIGYRAYSLREQSPSAVAIDEDELAQFRRYGLSRVVNLRALTVGSSSSRTDDWDASVTVLRYRDAAGAKAELDYSNTENKKTGRTIAIPGFPDVTAFVNTESGGLTSVGAFTTTGRYQVVVVVRGLAANAGAGSTRTAAEAARVLRAVLPSAAAIANADAPPSSDPLPVPTPSPSGTRA